MKQKLLYKSPLKILISFHKVIETLEKVSLSEVSFQADYAKGLITEIQKYPELINGIEKMEDLPKYESILKVLLADLFPKALTNNEIKAITIPFHTYAFNYTERFKKILSEAGMDFKLNIRDFSEDYFYIMNCCVVINRYFGYKVDIDAPLFVDIPDSDNITRHYRALFNADFMDFIPTEKAKILSEEEIYELLDNSDNIELWKEKFPEESWILKGFSIISLYDATTENAVSSFKSNLLNIGSKAKKFAEMEAIFKSIYKIPDLKIGFTAFNDRNKNIFHNMPTDVYSHLLYDSSVEECKNLLCNKSFEKLTIDKQYVVVSDIDHYEKSNPEEAYLVNHLKKQNVSSFIFAPLVDNDTLFGILELSSSQPKAFNSVNANKLSFVLPLIRETVSRAYSELENEVEAVIQREYTSIHPSVKWRFQEEVANYITAKKHDKDYILKDIVFKEVYPLYGQIDVQGSSNSRNKAIQEDLKTQINALILILERINERKKLPFIEQKLFELKNHLSEVDTFFFSDSEHRTLDYIQKEIDPVLLNFVKSNGSDDPFTTELIHSYFREIDTNNGAFYQSRKMFDESVAVINKKLAMLIDEKQVEAQSYFPHYYERFKTDGIEHNMYMGASIVPSLNFEKYYLYNLRLWQMQVMCEMENYFHTLKPELSYELEVSSLILVFATPISVRFRMDEKQFDIDGSYNVRYEIAKKRIDKAKIKNSDERITQKGKLTIVYSQHQEETEYLGYIKLLQHKGLLSDEVEKLEVEDLQGLMGMKALRVGIAYHNPTDKIYKEYKTIEV